jgi:hypothetical protein
MRLNKTMMVAVAAPLIAISPVPRTMAMSIPLAPQAPMAFGLGDITGMLDQFMPLLDNFLKDYMGGFFGDNFGLFQTVFDNVFGQLQSGARRARIRRCRQRQWRSGFKRRIRDFGSVPQTRRSDRNGQRHDRQRHPDHHKP